MGLFDRLLGNALEVNTGRLESEFIKCLFTGEQIEHAYRLFCSPKGQASNIAIYDTKACWAFNKRKEP